MGFIPNPSNAKATFVQSTRMQRFLNHLNPVMLVFIGLLLLSISDEYPYARVSIIFQLFCIIFYGKISHQQHKGYFCCWPLGDGRY